MSGPVANNIFRSSGVIAAAAGGLIWNSTVITGSTVTVESGNGYWIDTSSNTCTITLPSSAAKGDQIILVDYARTWGTYAIIIDSNGNNYQGDPDTFTVEYNTSGQNLNIVYSDVTKGWVPLEDDTVEDVPIYRTPSQRAIFAFGSNSSGKLNVSNLVNSSGAIASDVTGVGTARSNLAAVNYGTDKAIFGFGNDGSATGVTNLVNNSGVVATNTSAVGTPRSFLTGVAFGVDLGLFAYGTTSNNQANSNVNTRNLINNSGVVATDVTGAGTARVMPGATRYGSTGQAIFAFGKYPSNVRANMRNLVSNTGVVASDVTGAGTVRDDGGATTYGVDTAVFAYGNNSINESNLVSNTGVIASDRSGVGEDRSARGTNYGGDKGIFAFGYGSSSDYSNVINLVSNTGVIAASSSGVGTGRNGTAGAGYSTTA
jgi:hypothetical protein|tara:strand:- start:250 stop:1536 length:1287 start_codon:yes stop_codon:yes gene_type:complete